MECSLTSLLQDAAYLFRLLRAALASVEYYPVGDDGRKQLSEFVSNIDLVDGLPFVGGESCRAEGGCRV